jgi:hypothetical protein
VDKLGKEKINVEIGVVIKVRTREPTNKLDRSLSPSDIAPSSLSGRITKYAYKTWNKSHIKSMSKLLKKQEQFKPEKG